MSKALQIPPGTRLEVARRDGPYCSRCGVSIVNIPSAVHHRFGKGMGGSRDPRINDLRNLTQVCGLGNAETEWCHGAIHSQPAKARDEGWIIRSLDDLDTPMRTRFGSRVTLTEDGDRNDNWPFDDVAPDLPSA